MLSSSAHTAIEPSSRSAPVLPPPPCLLSWTLSNCAIAAGCNKFFRLQIQRFKEHIQKKHADVAEVEGSANAEPVPASAAAPSAKPQVTALTANTLVSFLLISIGDDMTYLLVCRQRRWILVQRQASIQRSHPRCCYTSGACRRSAPRPAIASLQLKRESRSQRLRWNNASISQSDARLHHSA